MEIAMSEDTLACKLAARLTTTMRVPVSPDVARGVLVRHAHHEAGHVASRLLLGDRVTVTSVTIDVDAASDGRPACTSVALVEWADDFDRAAVRVGGPLAAWRYHRTTREAWPWPWPRPANTAEWRQERAAMDRATFNVAVREMRRLIERRWTTVQRVAHRLLAGGTLRQPDVEALLEG
jgi:hypothetical protein